MIKCLWIFFCIPAGILAQSYDLKKEKEALARIEAAISAGKHAEFVRECNELLDPHRINALAWYICGKNLLNVPVTDIQQSRANARTAYVRLKRATDEFARTGKQVFYATDAQQYLGLAAMLLSDLDRAQVHFRSVLARDNRIAEAWYNLGVIYELKGLQEESMRAFDGYLRLKNTDAASEF
jgi:tetratricopeptide (TPR) repeat protein